MFRNSKYVERYEDVVFELETALDKTLTRNQKKEGHRFVVDNTGEVTAFDWYNARIAVDFKVVLAANGGNITAANNNGIVNGSHSLVNNFKVSLNGRKVFDLNDANHCVNIKNLLEYGPAYADTTATNEFFFLDTNRSAMATVGNADFNKGFAIRKALLGTSTTVNTEISLNRYSFFGALRDELLPNTRLELNLELESDGNLIWRAAGGADCRVVLTKMQLFVPRITFNSEGQSLYAGRFITNKKWTYLREEILRSNSSTQRSGHFNITSGISKPRHVFVFIINDASIGAHTANQFLYNTFSVSTDPHTLQNCHLVVANGNEYPEIHYTPATDMTRVYRDVLKYVHKNNEYGEGSLLNRSNFSTIFPFIYFDLTNQKLDIRDGTTKLTFRYKLSGITATPYSIYALILYEQEAELVQKDGKLMFR